VDVKKNVNAKIMRNANVSVNVKEKRKAKEKIKINLITKVGASMDLLEFYRGFRVIL
jgi:hypothetical protein